MGAFISQQPNGLYCRFSSIVDTVTHWNMTKDNYIEMCIEKAKRDAIDILENNLEPFDMVKDKFCPNSISKAKFKGILLEMEKEIK